MTSVASVVGMEGMEGMVSMEGGHVSLPGLVLCKVRKDGRRGGQKRSKSVKEGKASFNEKIQPDKPDKQPDEWATLFAIPSRLHTHHRHTHTQKKKKSHRLHLPVPLSVPVIMQHPSSLFVFGQKCAQCKSIV